MEGTSLLIGYNKMYGVSIDNFLLASGMLSNQSKSRKFFCLFLLETKREIQTYQKVRIKLIHIYTSTCSRRIFFAIDCISITKCV